MNIYLISQNINTDYDSYDSAVVVAKSEEDARMIHPSQNEWDGEVAMFESWAAAKDVKVEFLATLPEGSEYKEGDLICSSFNAG